MPEVIRPQQTHLRELKEQIGQLCCDAEGAQHHENFQGYYSLPLRFVFIDSDCLVVQVQLLCDFSKGV